MSCAFHGDNRMQCYSPDSFSLFALAGAGLRDYTVNAKSICKDFTIVNHIDGAFVRARTVISCVLWNYMVPLLALRFRALFSYVL